MYQTIKYSDAEAEHKSFGGTDVSLSALMLLLQTRRDIVFICRHKGLTHRH